MQYFKDEWYYRAKNYVHNTITEQEYKLYKAGKIRKLYDSFEYLLLDNLKYYNRIIRTIIWLYENELIDHGKSIDKINKNEFKVPMTPTVFYYIILLPIDATRDECLLAFPSIASYSGENFVELFKPISKINAFKFNMAYCKGMYECKTYLQTLERDITNTSFLSKITEDIDNESIPLTRAGMSKALEETMLTVERMANIYHKINRHLKKRTQFVNIKPTRISIFDANSEHECKYENGKIVRQSVRNFRGCFEYDAIFSKYLKEIYQWAETSIDNYENELIQIMRAFVLKYRRKALAVRVSANQDLVSYIQFRKCWTRYKLIENTYFRGALIKTESYVVSADNVGKMLFKQGYFVIGKKDQQDELLEYATNLDTDNLIILYMDFVEMLNKSIDKLLVWMEANLKLELEHLEEIYR